VLLAAFEALIAGWSEQGEFCVATPTSTRGPAETGVVGYFVSALPIRADVAPAATFEELVAAARERVIDALANGGLSTEAILREAGWDREPGRNPLLQVMLQVDRELSPPDFGGPEVEFVELPRQASAADLSLELRSGGSGKAMKGLLEYSCDLYDQRTAALIADQFLSLLSSALREPSAAIGNLDSLSRAERDCLERFNETAREWPAAPSLHALVEEQAGRTPDAVAVEDGEARLTYAELDRHANRLAHRLREAGVGPERIAGVCVPRSADLLIAVLAVLKAGGAYLPLDPEYPSERLAFMIEDARPEVVITVSALLEGLPDPEAELVVLDLEAEAVEALPEESPGVDLDLDNLALVIYTSGSTGRPKGAALTHGAVVNFARATVDDLGLDRPTRLLQFAPWSFDTHLEEVYPTLLSGGTLVLRDDEMTASPRAFFEGLEDKRVDVASIPTAFWKELTAALREGELRPPAALSLLIIGGEKAPAADTCFWCSDEGPPIALMNTYGPTEATTSVLSVRLSAEEPSALERAETISGRPLPNARLYVLDEEMRRVPRGVTGMICLGGPQLAREYVGRPRLTAERFLPDPYGDGERLYVTGDRGRHAPDLAVEIVGRVDDQVKVRGFRVEPGEVESALRAQAGIADAAVVVERGEDGHASLLAYCVAAEDGLDAGAVRSAAARSLPGYMVPSAIALVDSLPRTPSGKLDRAALAPLTGDREEAATSYVPPQTEVERVVTEIWVESLKLERVGVEDRFFELGGHSLAMMRVATRIERAFDVQVPLKSLLTSETPRAMAAMVERIIAAEVEAMSDEEVAHAVADLSPEH
jgi:amino acid adenylation domain-containing protein